MKTEAVFRRAARRALLVAALGGVFACGGSESVIIVYSPHGPEQLRLFERSFESLNPAIDVQWVDMGSQEILDRVRSERPNPQGDVWYGGPDVFFARTAAEGLLEAYRPS